MGVVGALLVVMVGVVGVTSAGREKRYLYVNPDAPITLGFLLNMPISLALPTLAPKFGRSFSTVSSNTLDDHTDRPEDLYWDPSYEQQLGKLSAYFAHLELPNLPCQERLICELSSDPHTFAPIGQIFMKEMRLLHGPVKTSDDSLMWRYMSAAREGFTAPIEDCARAYPTCPLPADRVLNMAVLKVWQYISSKLNLQLV